MPITDYFISGCKIQVYWCHGYFVYHRSLSVRHAGKES